MAGGLQIRAKKVKGTPQVAILHLSGAMTETTLEHLDGAVAQCRKLGHAHLVLDLEGVGEGFDSAGFSWMLKHGVGGGTDAARLAFARPPESVQRLLLFLGFNIMLKVFPRLEDAVRWAKEGRDGPRLSLRGVYPVLATEAWCSATNKQTAGAFADIADRARNMLISAPLVDALRVVYVHEVLVGLTGKVEYLQPRHLEELGVGEEELKRRALANLAERHAAAAFNVSKEGDVGRWSDLVLVTGNQHLVASLVLVEPFVEELREHLGVDPVIATPGRDVLVAFGDDHLRGGPALDLIADFVEKSPRALDRSIRRHRKDGKVQLVREA